jgi:hypothetical protein
MLKILAALLLCGMVASATDAVVPLQQYATQAAPDARYEIVVIYWHTYAGVPDATFRLDRFTGKIAQLVSNRDDGARRWVESEVPGLPEPQGDRARFQISQANSQDSTFLLDMWTGQAWEWVLSDNKNAFGPRAWKKLK